MAQPSELFLPKLLHLLFADTFVGGSVPSAMLCTSEGQGSHSPSVLSDTMYQDRQIRYIDR